jgi:hypothetical protein
MNQRELASRRLAAIRKAEKDGSLGPFAPDPKPKNAEKLSPLSAKRATNFADRKEQEAHFGLSRGRNASYKGD